MQITKIIAKDHILDLISSKKDNVLKEMIFSLGESSNITNINEFYKAIIEREKIKSTAIGNGIAIPHVLIPEVSDLFIALGRKKEGFDFDSPDGKPVHLLILIGAPLKQKSELIELLAKIVLSFKKDELRNKVLSAGTEKELLKLLSGI